MFNLPSFLFLLFPVQEEIKIIEVEVFVNPYTEPDEEDEKKSNEEKKVEDEENVSSGSNLKLWFPPPPQLPLSICFPSSVLLLVTSNIWVAFLIITFRIRLAHGTAIQGPGL